MANSTGTATEITGAEHSAIAAMDMQPITAAIAYLAKTQHSSGYWTDFWLKAGTSDAWVTAYTGVLLCEVAEQLTGSMAQLTRDRANLAADWLLKHINNTSFGWGYNATTVSDADTTAWAVMLLAHLKRPIPAQTLDFLQAHQAPDGLFKTYRFRPATTNFQEPSQNHQWAQPCIDVSLSVATALLAANTWSLSKIVDYWTNVIAPQQTSAGTFIGYWWAHPQFPTWLAWRLWRAIGQPVLSQPWPAKPKDAFLENDAFSQACSYLESPPVPKEIAQLLHQQQFDGSWASVPILRVPPSHEGLIQVRPVFNRDARRIFTTATVLAVLTPQVETVSNSSTVPDVSISSKAKQKSTQASTFLPGHSRSAYGQQCDELVERIATSLDFTPALREQAIAHFQSLTQASLAKPNSWPAAQVSALSMGAPLEFSATTDDARALRYTCEICDPVLPGAQQIDTGLRALKNTANQLGCGLLWQNLAPVWNILRAGADPLPQSVRFRLWAGIAQAATALPTLKIYVNTLLAASTLNQSGRAQSGLTALLTAAKIPYTGQLKWLCNKLKTLGFPQEIGFGLRGDGKWGVKIYYDFFGWRPALITEIAQTLGGFPEAAKKLNPAIPGILPESLLKKHRSGLSFRVHPTTGQIVDLTTTAAFPVQLVPAKVSHERILTWMRSHEANPQAYQQLFSILHSQPSSPHHRSYSLLTRTLDLSGHSKTTIYLRPNGTDLIRIKQPAWL